MFIALLGRADDDRRSASTSTPGSRSAASMSSMDLLYDQLSALFLLLITGVGSLIHIYSIGYMEHDARRRRFFAYLNLFVAAMLTLVLAENYLGAVPRLGGRRPRVVPADRLLAAQAARRPRRPRRPSSSTGSATSGMSLAIMLMFVTFGTRFTGVSAAAAGAVRAARSTRSACCCCSAPAASRPRCRCRPGCSTRWRARPRCRR